MHCHVSVGGLVGRPGLGGGGDNDDGEWRLRASAQGNVEAVCCLRASASQSSECGQKGVLATSSVSSRPLIVELVGPRARILRPTKGEDEMHAFLLLRRGEVVLSLR